MSLIVVGMGDLKVSTRPDDTLVTFALGSCIGVTVYDPHLQIGGMIHYMLPCAKTSPTKAARQPAMFASVGVPLLFRRLYKLGAVRERLEIKVAGGSRFNVGEHFDIGRRNYVILRQMLKRQGLKIQGEDVGGRFSRTIWLRLSDGRLRLRAREMDLSVGARSQTRNAR